MLSWLYSKCRGHPYFQMTDRLFWIHHQLQNIILMATWPWSGSPLDLALYTTVFIVSIISLCSSCYSIDQFRTEDLFD